MEDQHVVTKRSAGFKGPQGGGTEVSKGLQGPRDRFAISYFTLVSPGLEFQLNCNNTFTKEIKKKASKRLV